MRIRRALAGLALGGALALGATAVPAQAAEGTTATQASASASGDVHPMASYHFYRAYWTLSACNAEGNALGYDYACVYGQGSDGNYKYFLYLWY
ncbi:hypothetical protein SHL15_7629 [Streptomyces hygroscopicus subsp. limoneus]|nr:hypothetical protein SHL15_7629 [Streptomyces hygroscopicus subsp. limoneus]